MSPLPLQMPFVAVLARIALGFVGLTALAALLAHPIFYTQAPASYSRKDMLRTEVFAPWLGPQRRHVIIGSCEVSLPIVANDMDKPGIPQRSEISAWLGNMLNFVLLRDYEGGREDRFYDISAPNTNLAHQAQLLWYASKVPDLTSIIFVNGLGLSTQLEPDDALEVVAALERMEADLPKAAPAIRAYADTLRRSAAYQDGERRHPDWRDFLDPDSATIEAPWARTLNAAEKRFSDGASASQKVQHFLVEAKAALNPFLGAPARLLHLPSTVLGADLLRRDEGVRRELNWAKTMTDRDDYRAAVAPFDDQPYLDGSEREQQRLWLEMLAAVAEERGARLIIYGQPMLSVSPQAHAAEFKPRYMDRMREWLAPWKPLFIDQTIDHDLGLRDFALTCPPGAADCTAPPFAATGYHANIVGRYRQSLLLLDALRRDGVLPHVRPAAGMDPAASLPAVDRDRCVEYEGRPGGCIPW